MRRVGEASDIYPPVYARADAATMVAWLEQGVGLIAAVIEDDDRVVAHVRLESLDPRAAALCGPGPWVEASRLMVDPACRRRGYARALLAWADTARPPASRLALVVMAKNLLARRAYEALGWSYVGAFPGRNGENFVMVPHRLDPSGW